MSRLAGRLLLPMPAFFFVNFMSGTMPQFLNHLRHLFFGSNIIGLRRELDDYLGAARPKVMGKERQTDSGDRTLQLVRKCSANHKIFL